MRVLVTGANGWVGRSAIQVLLDKYPNFEVVGTSRTPGFLNVGNQNKIKLVTLQDSVIKDRLFDGLIHTAFPTQNLVEKLGQNEYTRQAMLVNSWLQKFGELNDLNFIFGISSGVVSLKENGMLHENEDPYADEKQKEEHLIKSIGAKGYSIGRLWAGSGRFIKNYRIYALGQFIESAINGNDIVIKSQKETFRRYCDVEQFCEIGIALSLDGFNKQFNSGGTLISIQDLAHKIGSRFSGVAIRSLNQGHEKFNQPNDYFPIAEDFDRFAERYRIKLFPMEEQITRSIIGVKRAIAMEVYCDRK